MKRYVYVVHAHVNMHVPVSVDTCAGMLRYVRRHVTRHLPLCMCALLCVMWALIHVCMCAHTGTRTCVYKGMCRCVCVHCPAVGAA